MHSCLCVPMRARGRTLGAIAFVSSESRRRYNEVDLTLAANLAARAALAVDNARLYMTAQRERGGGGCVSTAAADRSALSPPGRLRMRARCSS
jgi:hypothetical protein